MIMTLMMIMNIGGGFANFYTDDNDDDHDDNDDGIHPKYLRNEYL